MSQNQVQILGTNIAALTLEEGLDQAKKLLGRPGAHYIVLPYVEFLTRAAKDTAVRAALNQADLALSNGVALNWAAQYLYGGQPGLGRLLKTLVQIPFHPQAIQEVLPARFDSANFTWPLLKYAATKRLRVFLVGSPKRQTIEAAGAYLARAIPGLTIAGCFSGHLGAGKEAQLLAKLQQVKPDLVLIGTGFPRQELLMQRLRSELSHGLMIGEGGSFDYEQYGGHLRRAPEGVQKIGLEWLWRLVCEPSRLGRQMAIPSFIWQVYRLGQTQGQSKA